MNVSMQIGRGLAALALCAAVSAYAVTHSASQAATVAIPTLPAVKVSANTVVVPAAVVKSRAAHDTKQRCSVAVPSIQVGAPVRVTEMNVLVAAKDSR